MRMVLMVLVVLAAWVSPLAAQEVEPVGSGDPGSGDWKKEKARPPRIPDGPFVPKRGMVMRKKGEFWAGPPDEGRFEQILTLTLIPREKLQEKLGEWPNYREFSPEQKERLAERIDQVRETARKQALEVAKEFQLRIEPGQEEEFVRMHWRERIQIDQALRQELFTKRKKLEKGAEERIFKKFPKSIKN